MAQNQNLEDVLRDLAARGEISHISLTPSQDGKMWRASFAMCSVFGISFAEDADPVNAIVLACTTARLKKSRASVKSSVEVVPAAAGDGVSPALAPDKASLDDIL